MRVRKEIERERWPPPICQAQQRGKKKEPWKQWEIKWPNILHCQLRAFFLGSCSKRDHISICSYLWEVRSKPIWVWASSCDRHHDWVTGRERSSYLASVGSHHLLSSYNRARWRPVIENVIHSVSWSTARKTKVIINFSHIAFLRSEAISIRWFH